MEMSHIIHLFILLFKVSNFTKMLISWEMEKNKNKTKQTNKQTNKKTHTNKQTNKQNKTNLFSSKTLMN